MSELRGYQTGWNNMLYDWYIKSIWNILFHMFKIFFDLVQSIKFDVGWHAVRPLNNVPD